MKKVKIIAHEEDITSLQAGDRIRINGEPYMFRKCTPKGGEHIPVWYSERTIDLRRQTKK